MADCRYGNVTVGALEAGVASRADVRAQSRYGDGNLLVRGPQSGAFRIQHRVDEIELTRTSIDQRSLLSAELAEPLLDRCDLALLKCALEEAEQEPVRRFPSLGPVAFRGLR